MACEGGSRSASPAAPSRPRLRGDVASIASPKGWSQPTRNGSCCQCCASLGKSKLHRCLCSCSAAGHSAIAEYLHSALKITAVWVFRVFLTLPSTDRET